MVVCNRKFAVHETYITNNFFILVSNPFLCALSILKTAVKKRPPFFVKLNSIHPFLMVVLSAGK